MYNYIQGNTTQPEDVSAFVDHLVLISLMHKVDSVKEGYLSKPEVTSLELTKSAVICRALDKFLFPGALQDKGGCFHQLVSRYRVGIEHPVVFVLSLHDGLPHMPLLVSDIKLDKYEDAVTETVLYGHTIADEMTKQDMVIFGLPMTTAKVGLLLLYPGSDGNMACIEIDSKSLSQSASLFSALHHFVHLFLDKPSKQRTDPNATFMLECEGKHTSFNYKVVKCELDGCKRVHKFCGDGNEVKILQEVLVKVGLNCTLPNAKVIPLTDDEVYQRIDYTYIEGDNIPRHLRQFIMIIKTLGEIHKLGYVHGDIRRSNLIFCDDSETAHIIDYDLTAKEGTLYPVGYNTTAECVRHPNAKPSWKMDKIHDRYSLSMIITEYLSITNYYKKQRLSIIVKKLNQIDVTLFDIAAELAREC